MFKFDLGARVKDLVTGYKGVIVSRTEFLNKCIRYAVQPTDLDKDGKVRECEHFDEEQLTIEGTPVKIEKQDRTGGPHDAPVQGHVGSPRRY